MCLKSPLYLGTRPSGDEINGVNGVGTRTTRHSRRSSSSFSSMIEGLSIVDARFSERMSTSRGPL